MDVKLEYVIVLGGLFILLYTVFGGIEVVIWTDVVQTIVLWGGAVVMFVYIAMAMPDGMASGWSAPGRQTSSASAPSSGTWASGPSGRSW